MNLEVTEQHGLHHKNCVYALTDYHCPRCGQKGVWEEQGDGDYYLGKDFVCQECGNEFCMQGNTEAHKGVADQLKARKTTEPLEGSESY